MTDMREKLAAAIAEKYSALKARSAATDVRGAISEDCALLGVNDPDALMTAFLTSMDAFDAELDKTVETVDFVRDNLNAIMTQEDMDEQARYKFLTTIYNFTQQAGVEQLTVVLSGENENVMRALMHMSKVMLCDVNAIEPSADVMERIIAAITGPNWIPVRDLDKLDAETGDELLRCYAAWTVFRDGMTPEAALNDDFINYIATQVRAGQREAKLLSDAESGRITGEQAAEGLKSVADVILAATSLFISSTAGISASMGVLNLVRLLFGVNGISMSIGVLAGLPTGLKVTSEVMQLCGAAGEWLEKHALEPAVKSTANVADGVINWVSDTAAPAVSGAFNGAVDACKGAGSGIMKGVDWVVSGVRGGADAVWKNVQPVLDKTGGFVIDWMENTGDELYSGLSRLLNAFNLGDVNGEM